MLRVAVVDDEPATREELVGMVERYAEENDVRLAAVAAADGADLLAMDPAPDIVLLDIEMDEVDGMKAARMLRRAGCTAEIVFVTNMAQYAIKGYEVGALDFVLKPVRYPVFAFKFARAVELAASRRSRRVVVETKGGVVRLDASEILYVEVRAHRLVYHTTEGPLELWGTMKSAASELEPLGFALCNACYLVNLDHVTRLEDGFATVGGASLKVSRGRAKAFADALARSMRGCANVCR